jgi:hypothetical protein
MDADLRAKWVAALRSGDYIQGEGALKRQDVDDQVRHCCLGVLCEVLDVPQVRRELDGGVSRWAFGEEHEEGYLPAAIQDQAGLASAVMTSLARMNDSGRYDFKAIADYIDQNL